MTASDGRIAPAASNVSRGELNRPQAASEVSVTRLIEERDGAVLILTIDQPARRNALAMPIRTAMISALEQAQAEKGVRAVVITGSGGHFCSGGDISGMDVDSALAGRERMRLSHQLIRLMVLGSLPVVAAVEGFCVGAGLSLACASDTVVASEDARFAAGFGKIGLMADLGLPHTLPMRVGQGRARQILFYHGQMSAPEAERIGIVDQVVPKGHALATALEKARFLAEQAPAPMALTKQMLGEGLDRALEQERHFQSTLFLTEDFREGRAAFLGKRTPAFKGT
jgi:2-(1,2-epoxy-1,2-dihydrophenyl)acetyl-CoA isomerase